MSDFINQIQDAFNLETTTSPAAELIPFTDLTGHTKYTIGTGSQQTTLSTGNPSHNTFAYLYATDNSDTILLKRLVLPVIQKHANKTTPVIDGAITTNDDVTLRDTNNTPVTFTLTTPDENIINDKPFIPESPVHENCKLISKATSEGIQSFSIIVPIRPYNNEEHVEIRNIPIHVETRVIRHPSQNGVITNTDTETQLPITEILDDTLPLHALDEDTQLDVFQFVLDSFDELDMQTQQSFLEMLPHVSDGVIKAHTTEITHLLYRTPSMYAREIGDVIPITPETIDEILNIITPRLSEFIESTDTHPAPILSTVTTISKTIHENTETPSQYNEFLKTVAYPIVKKEIHTLSELINTHTVDVKYKQEQWVAGDGFTHRINAVLPWLLKSTITIEEEFLRGVIHLSSTDETISDSFIIELLCSDYDNAITDTVMQNAVTTTDGVVEQVLIKHLRGEKTTADTVSESRARTAAETFEQITDRDVIRREPPTGYASTTASSVTTKEEHTQVNNNTEESDTDSNDADTTTEGDDVHEQPSDSDTPPSGAQSEKTGGSVTGEHISEEPIDENPDLTDSSDTSNETASETSAEVNSDSTEEKSNTESMDEKSDVSEPTETNENNNNTNENEDEDENEGENGTVSESGDVAEESADAVNENDDGDNNSDANGDGVESESESTNNSMSLTDF